MVDKPNVESFLGAIFNKAQIPYVGSRVSGAPRLFQSKNNAERQMAALGSVGTLFAIVNRTSNAVSQVEWKLWRKSTSGKDEDRVEVTSHLALDIWNKPNPFYTQQEFIESFQQHLELTGEGWWSISSNSMMRKVPSELWVMRPDKVEPVRSKEEFLTGYTYKGPDGEDVPLGKEEVIQLRVPNPLDPYRGMGPVQSIFTTLESTRLAEEWNRNFFYNSALPNGIIEVEKRLSDEEFGELATRWEEQHRGVSRAHRVAILEHGTYKETKYTMEDMQFSELRKVSREVIREAFGFPLPLLGTSENVNRANADAAEVAFARWLVKPRLERIKGALNNDFLPLFGTTGKGLEFDYVNPVPEDRAADDSERTSKVNAAVALLNAGVEPEDAFSAMGLPVMRVSKPEPVPVMASSGGEQDA